MLRSYFILFLLLFIFLFPRNIFAESTYVLPYPSAMPGSIFYKLNLIQEEVLKYWYFGDFGQFKYNLTQADKYLVEAKTLFEYKQYLLGYNALNKSNLFYKKVKPALTSARKHGKDIVEKSQTFKRASQKHIEELEKMKKNIPEVFEWKPEKGRPSNLDLGGLISRSAEIRKLAL